MLPVNPEHHLPVIFAPGIKTRIISWCHRFRNLLYRHEPCRRRHLFGRLRPGVEDINHLALVTQDFRANLLAYSFRIDARQPEWNGRSEEHTSELQSRLHLVCRLLLEKKKEAQGPSHCEPSGLRPCG